MPPVAASAALDPRLSHMLDRTEIVDLVRLERHYRDTRDWAGLAGSYVPGAPVRTTWFSGTIEEFAAGSRRKMAASHARPSTAKHWIFPSKLDLNGDRALVESPATIFDRQTFDGVEFDYMQYCRFVVRIVRTPQGWRLASFDSIYQRDTMECVNPADTLPVDWAQLATLRPSYRVLAYVQMKQGYAVSPDLLGDDRPDLLAAFYAGEQRWLETGE